MTDRDERSPVQPLPLGARLLNRAGAGLRAVGLPLLPLDETALLERAARNTGLDDFGEPWFRQPLRVLLDALEREAALTMLGELPAGPRITLGTDKAYDIGGFIDDVRELGVTPHVAQNLARRGGSAIDGRTTRHPGYPVSQRIRKRIEEAFGWAKTVGPVRKTKFRGVSRVGFQFVLTMAAYNLVRMRTLLHPAPT